MRRALLVVATFVVSVTIWLVVSTRSTAEPTTTIPVPETPVLTTSAVLVERVTNEAQVVRFRRLLKRAQRKLAHSQQRLYVARIHQRQLKRVLLHSSGVREAIDLSCAVYGNCSTLWRKASCESTYDPRADNGHARGLFQFLDSTWSSTPFGRFDVFSPYANALAAGWMHARGRGGEWSCR